MRFTTTAALVSELIEARDEKKLLRFQKQIASYELLIVDELGFVPLSKTGAELLFEMLSQRYERGSTLVTSNLPFQEWTEILGSERLTGALLDRLTYHVNILEMNGDSYRLKQSRRKRNPSAEPLNSTLQTHLGVDGPLPLRSRDPSTPQSHNNYTAIQWPILTPPHWLGFTPPLTHSTAFVEYALQNIAKPIGISTYRVTRELPTPIREELPSVEDLQEVVTQLRSEMDHLRQEQQDE